MIRVIFLFTALISISCEEENIITDDQGNMFYATINVDFRNVIAQDSLPHYWYIGYIISSKVTELKCIVIEKDTISYYEPSVNYFNDGNGLIRFNMPYEKLINVVPLANFEVVTGIGSLNGDVIFPDSVTSIEFNKEDTLGVNETLVMSFNGNADYYLIYYSYEYLNPDSTGTIGENRELLVKQNTAFFDSVSSPHPYNGYLYISSIGSFNGPIPEINSLPNMAGDGKGYLNVRLHQYLNKVFVVGLGYNL